MSIDNDSSLLYGEISASPLETIETILCSQFSPLLSNLDNNIGNNSFDHKSYFDSELFKFSDNVGTVLHSMSKGIELKSIENNLINLKEICDPLSFTETIDEDSILQIAQLQSVFDGWCNDIESYLSAILPMTDSQTGSLTKIINIDDRNKVSGPRAELEYWRNRMQRLNSVVEKQQSSKCAQLVTLLSEIEKKSLDNRYVIQSLLRRWEAIDRKVMEASNEAKDNIKYLSSLQRFVGPFYDGNIKAMSDALPAVVNSIKVSFSDYRRLCYA